MHTLYACLGSGNCFKPWLALQQLGQPVRVELIDVLKGEQKSDGYLRINPDGVVPFLRTDSGRGIGESNAMLWFIAEGTHLMPDNAEDRAEALQWMFFEQSKLEPYISPARFFTTILPDQREARKDDIAAWQALAAGGLARLNAHLSNRTYMLSSGYSVADIAVFGYVHVLEEAGLSLADYPSIALWIDAVRETAGFQPLAELGQADLRAA